jgi:hypothetical protein
VKLYHQLNHASKLGLEEEVEEGDNPGKNSVEIGEGVHSSKEAMSSESINLNKLIYVFSQDEVAHHSSHQSVEEE